MCCMCVTYIHIRIINLCVHSEIMIINNCAKLHCSTWSCCLTIRGLRRNCNIS